MRPYETKEEKKKKKELAMKNLQETPPEKNDVLALIIAMFVAALPVLILIIAVFILVIWLIFL
jgi:hypothetical protein